MASQVWGRIFKWLFEPSRRGLHDCLKKPTKSIAVLPADVIESINRVNRRYKRSRDSLLFLAVASFAIVLVALVASAVVNGDRAPLPGAVSAVITVAVCLGLVSVFAEAYVERTAGDYIIESNLVRAIDYIDSNLDEWPATAHKYKLSQLIDGAANGFRPYLKQLSTKMTPEYKSLAKRHRYGLASLKDEVSMSDRKKLGAIQIKLVRQLKYFSAGKWDLMLAADLPPKDKTTAPKRRLIAQCLVVLLLLGGVGAVAWFYRGEWAGTMAAGALVIALLALVFMFVPNFAGAFSAAIAAFKGVKEATPPSMPADESQDAESSEKS